jgi:serine/threonine protein kinase
MPNLTYHLSENILNNLKEIDKLRIEILTTPIKPNIEVKLKWEADINKTYWGLNLADNPLTKSQISKLLSNEPPKRLSNHQKEVIDYITTLRVIRNIFTANTVNLTTRDVLNIYDLSCKNVYGSSLNYYKSKEELVEKILNFIETGKDHPVIKAGLLQIEIIKLSPFENATGRVARLLSHLILAKYGYDIRGLLILEDYYREDLVGLKEATGSIEKYEIQHGYKNASFWLEYFTNGVKRNMQRLQNEIKPEKQLQQRNNHWKLTERQKQIFEILDNPNIKMTNKSVQKMFKISQITASRDLSKMVSLGLLLSHGKGRSVFYTR